MTVLATIHQPSSEIFYTFDRVILLSEGFTIYNGPPSEAKVFLDNLGVKFGKYTNPADVLLKLANDPKLINKDLTI
jgi:ABC-type multidrug transport system ATPase subunit